MTLKIQEENGEREKKGGKIGREEEKERVDLIYQAKITIEED